jgi:hypothetical protein
VTHTDADHCTRHHTYLDGCRYNVNNVNSASRPWFPTALRPGQGTRLNNLTSRHKG